MYVINFLLSKGFMTQETAIFRNCPSANWYTTYLPLYYDVWILDLHVFQVIPFAIHHTLIVLQILHGYFNH